MAFYKRIRDLREDSDKTQTELAEYLGTTAQYYGKYESGEREMPFSRAILLAKYYHVSLDYLAELSGQKHFDHFSETENHLLSDWAELSADNQKLVNHIMQYLLLQQRSGE